MCELGQRVTVDMKELLNVLRGFVFVVVVLLLLVLYLNVQIRIFFFFFFFRNSSRISTRTF